MPRSPGAWLTTTARRRALDALRRDRTLRAKLPLLIEPDPEPGGLGRRAGRGDRGAGQEDDVIPDDRLRLVFTCCHPALAREAQVALTLRLVCGLTTAEIAQAFLVSEPTMAARVTRAKKKISAARIAYRVPGEAELPDRLDAVLTVVHLLLHHRPYRPGRPDGWSAPTWWTGPSAWPACCATLMPDEREVRGLLALLLLTDARRATRTDAAGRLLLLEDQDRAQWDRAAIEEGISLVPGALRGGCPGRFALQAAIAALHAEAPSYATTDWPQVLAALRGAAAGLAVAGGGAEPGGGAGRWWTARRRRWPRWTSSSQDGRLAGYRYLPAAKADLLRRLGRRAEAADAYRAALELADNEAERDFLARRIAERRLTRGRRRTRRASAGAAALFSRRATGGRRALGARRDGGASGGTLRERWHRPIQTTMCR